MALRSPSVRDGLLVPDPDLVIVPEWGKAWPASWRRHLEQRALSRIDDVFKSFASTSKVSGISLDADELPA